MSGEKLQPLKLGLAIILALGLFISMIAGKILWIAAFGYLLYAVTRDKLNFRFIKNIIKINPTPMATAGPNFDVNAEAMNQKLGGFWKFGKIVLLGIFGL